MDELSLYDRAVEKIDSARARIPTTTTLPKSLSKVVQSHAVCVGIDDLLAMQLPEREPILAPWLTEQSLSMLYAWRGLGKSWLALSIARALPKRSLAQVFVLVACALLAVGIARMLAVPVFLTLFLMGVLLAARDQQQTLRYTELPEGHWLLAIVLFVIVGASLPWQEFTWLVGLQALGVSPVIAAWAGMASVLGVRLLAMAFRITLPIYSERK